MMSSSVDDDNSYEGVDNEHCSELVSARLPNSNNIIKGQKDAYAIGKKIAPGKYGAVYEVLRKRDGKTFAAKLEVCDISTRALSMDYMVLKAANKAKRSHFCTLIDRGMIQKHFKFLVMNRLGENLYKLRLQFQQCRFSAPTALRLSLEMLDALEELHSLGYVHRDVKPSNFAMLEEKGRSSRVILLDFGLCRQFRTASGEMKQPRENTQFRGTIRYASLAAHRAQEQSPKDDLESWLYVVSEFMSGDLPWSGLHSAEREQVRRAKEQARTSEGMAQLFKFCPKLEFRRIIAYLDKLKYNSLPDYQFIRDLIILAMRNNDIRLDEPFDWEQIDEEEATTADGKWHQQNGQKGVGTSNGPLLLNGK